MKHSTYLQKKTFGENDYFSILASPNIVEYRAISPEKTDEFRAAQEEMDVIFNNRITRAIKDGELRNKEPVKIYEFIQGALHHMLLTRWSCKTLEGLMDAIDVYIEFLFDGISEK